MITTYTIITAEAIARGEDDLALRLEKQAGLTDNAFLKMVRKLRSKMTAKMHKLWEIFKKTARWFLCTLTQSSS